MTSCRKILPLKWECLHLPSARRKMVTLTGIEVTLPFLSRKKAFYQILFSVSRGISMMRRLRDGWWNLRTVRMAGQPVGLRHGVRWLPHSGLEHVLGHYDSAARDAYFARNGWRNYCVPGDTEILELCPACAAARPADWPTPGSAPRMSTRMPSGRSMHSSPPANGWWRACC